MTYSIFQADCFEWLASDESKVFHGSVQLVYLDPPWFVQKDFGAFNDRWPSIEAYHAFVQRLLWAVEPMLQPGGSVVLHLDQHVSHYAKIVGDQIFGYRNFASEIIWRYRRWPTKTSNFQRVHNTLLRWIVRPMGKELWHQLYEPLAPSTRKLWGTTKQLASFDANGRRRKSTSTDETSPGVPMGDVWDIPIIAPMAKERTGYPAQKPVALLERLVLALTDEGGIVLDPCCGSGTSGVAAAKHGRRWFGCDKNGDAVEIVRRRMEGI
jgi:site-specific DNA-methyltransferase (adenine-specific)